MVTCPECHIAFSASCRCCPLCRKFEVPFPEFAKYLATVAESQLEAGESSKTVETMLVAQGFSEVAATNLVGRCREKVRRRTRSHGLYRLFVGTGSVLLGSGVVVVLLIFEAKHRLGGLKGVLAVGGGLFIFGCFAMVSGFLSVVTGCETPVAAPESVTDVLSDRRYIEL